MAPPAREVQQTLMFALIEQKSKESFADYSFSDEGWEEVKSFVEVRMRDDRPDFQITIARCKAIKDEFLEQWETLRNHVMDSYLNAGRPFPRLLPGFTVDHERDLGTLFRDTEAYARFLNCENCDCRHVQGGCLFGNDAEEYESIDEEGGNEVDDEDDGTDGNEMTDEMDDEMGEDDDENDDDDDEEYDDSDDDEDHDDDEHPLNSQDPQRSDAALLEIIARQDLHVKERAERCLQASKRLRPSSLADDSQESLHYILTASGRSQRDVLLELKWLLAELDQDWQDVHSKGKAIFDKQYKALTPSFTMVIYTQFKTEDWKEFLEFSAHDLKQKVLEALFEHRSKCEQVLKMYNQDFQTEINAVIWEGDGVLAKRDTSSQAASKIASRKR